MGSNAQFHHPSIYPYSHGAWRDVLRSWVLGGVVTGLILMTL